MRSLVLIVVLAVAVNARPEPPSGYNYRAPAPAPQPGYQQQNHGGYQQQNHGGYQQQNHGGYQSHGQGHAGAHNSGFAGGFQQQQQPQTIVQKHIYVHVPPPEEEAQVFQAQQQLAQPRKHYKIIFIKAPSAPSLTQQIAAAQAQNEEKTLIYVLVKKPEDISIPEAPAQVNLPVSKPEVYFIKYKTQKDHSGAGSSGSGFGVDAHSHGSSSSSSGSGYHIDAPAVNPQATYGAPIKK